MSANMQGMDTEYGREVGQNMGQQAGQVASMVSAITSMIQGLKWQGPDRENFANDWHGSFAPQAHNAAQTLDEQGRVLLWHADRQDAASS
ncbi:hypothetical protein [Nocardioides aquiterrae]|uniref:WXG100 family type VII secretion target n=1 Tax=Nocardioides aquiterrae TaxID=203799 RepID=A0ABN1UPH7_9ACTN